MGIFDKLKNDLKNEANSLANKMKTGKETIVINKLPESLDELKALPEASLDTPFKAAALTVCALCAYAADKQIGTEMLNWLKGPRPLSAYEISFLNDRFRDGKYYVPFSYFAGATPDNDYTPSEPFTLTIEAGPYAYDNEGYAKLDLRSGGADSPRQITLRKKGDGQWLLWEQFILVDIRTPKSQDPWA